MYYASSCARPTLISLALAGLLLVTPLGAAAQESAIDLDLARSYFAQARQLSDRDAGDTWGLPLYGPMLFVDRATRTLVANQADREDRLRPQNGVFVGRLPENVNCANTATDWAGVYWTMLVWPLPEDEGRRGRLMMHESYHRVQEELGLPMSNPENGHLDTRDGRIWIQLEWRALDRALNTEGKSRNEAIRDALTFRRQRHRMFDSAAEEERALEINEGLAEYTGVRVAHRRGLRAEHARAALENAPRRPTLMRSFAYASGPAYGLLLDDAAPGWRSSLDGTVDLGRRLARSRGLALDALTEVVAHRRAEDYGGEALMAAETERDRVRAETARRDRRRLLEDPILILSLSDGVSYSFNPSNLRTLAELGTVYPTMRVSDRWGVLEVDGDALLIRDGGKASAVHVVAPDRIDTSTLEGEGWALTLQPGWTVEPGDRIGDYRLAVDPARHHR